MLPTKRNITSILQLYLYMAALLLLSACGGTNVIVVTVTPPPATPTPFVVTVTPPGATATSAPDPTPTREVVETLDCQTLTLVTDEFPAVNANPCFRVFGSLLISERPVETPDNRQWDRLDEYRILYRPGSADTPPWVFWRDLGGSHPRGLRMEIDQINGAFGYSQRVYLRAGERYVLKIEGQSEVINAGAANVVVGGMIIHGLGEKVRLTDWSLEQTGRVEAIWVVEPDTSRVVTWEAWIGIRWASAFGAFTWQGMRVERAPDNFGDDVVIKF